MTSEKNHAALIFLGLVLTGLLFTSFHNYLLFHSLAELFSVAVAWCIFMIAWNTRAYAQNAYLLVIGVAYLFVSGLDLLHTLAYKGMAIFPGDDANLPTQLWIAARCLESLSLAAGLLFMRRAVSAEKLFAAYVVAFTLIIWAVFTGRFPDCYIEGVGLTRFKIISEYVICGVLTAVLILLVRRRDAFDAGIFRLIILSVLLTIGAELAFTFYISVYGLSNLIGHYFKLGSFFLIYLALIESGLRGPFRLLFRELKQYETIVSTISDPISCVDRNYVYQAANETYAAYAKIPRDEIVGMTVPALLGNDVFESRIKPRLDQCFSGEEVRYQAWFDIPDEPARFMDAGYYPIFDDAGAVIGAAVNARDMTHIKAAEDALKIYKEIVSSTPDAIAFLNRDYRYVVINDAYETFSNVSREEFLGLTVAEYLGEDVFREKVKPNFDRCLGGETIQFQDWFEYPTMGRRFVDVTYFPFRDEENRISGIVAATRDITELKLAEMALQHYAEHLEEMVAARTRDLEKAQEELLVKERLAVLGHFSGSISHELRNPLAAIDASAYYLNMTIGNHDEKTRENLNRIRSNVRKGTGIIESLLNLSRMEKPKTAPCDLRALIPETLGAVGLPDGVETVVNFPEGDAVADIDPEQIRMALKNVIHNAVQAMDGSGVLTVTVQPCGAGIPACRETRTGMSALQADAIEISIADSGPGISPDHLEKVFEPLFTTKTHGIGFGLSITRMIIENHGGTVRAAAGPENGAVFTFILPLAAVPDI